MYSSKLEYLEISNLDFSLFFAQSLRGISEGVEELLTANERLNVIVWNLGVFFYLVAKLMSIVDTLCQVKNFLEMTYFVVKLHHTWFLYIHEASMVT